MPVGGTTGSSGGPPSVGCVSSVSSNPKSGRPNKAVGAVSGYCGTPLGNNGSLTTCSGSLAGSSAGCCGGCCGGCGLDS